MKYSGSFYVSLAVLFELIKQSTPSLDMPTPTPCEDGLPYCEQADDYPTHYINELLKIQPEYILRYFNRPVDVSLSVEDRNIGGMDVCPSRTRVIYPKKIEESGKTEFVVNVVDNKQGVEVEECISTEMCPIIKELTRKYTSECRQKKMWRTLVVFNPANNTGMVTKSFEFPTGCVCSITPDHDV